MHLGRNEKEIAWIYRKRFGRVLRTTLILENGILYFYRELAGNSQKLSTPYFTMSFEKRRPYIEGEVLWDFFQKLSDPNVIKIELEVFVGFVLENFKTKTKGILDDRCYDVAMANTIIEKRGKYHFFDFEFKMKNGVPSSYLVYRIIRNSCFKEEDKRKLYSYLCHKYNIQDTYDFWEVFHDISEEDLLLPPKNNIIHFKFIKKVFIRILLYILFIIPKERRISIIYKLKENLLQTYIDLYHIYFEYQINSKSG